MSYLGKYRSFWASNDFHHSADVNADVVACIVFIIVIYYSFTAQHWNYEYQVMLLARYTQLSFGYNYDREDKT